MKTNELLATECSYSETPQVNEYIFNTLTLLTKASLELCTLSSHIAGDKNRTQHGMIGLVTESAELFDAYKKHWFYGKELDVENVKEEMGDLIWYIELLDECTINTSHVRLYLNLMVDIHSVTYNECREKVVKKLRVRYPDGFTQFDAYNRDTGAEMEEFTNG